MKMISPLYLAGLAFMVIYTNTDAFHPTEAAPRQCYQCSGTACGGDALSAAPCPADRPYCATHAAEPNFTSILTCAAGNGKLCSLVYLERKYEMTCVCSGNLCNSQFTKRMQLEMINFSRNNNSHINDLTEEFWKHFHLDNDNETYLYKLITVQKYEASSLNTLEVSEPTTLSKTRETTMTPALVQLSKEMPQAEALRQQMAVPSEDDEDESEGSGADEERRVPAAPAAPAEPSSHLPAADQSSAPSLLAELLVVNTLTLLTILI